MKTLNRIGDAVVELAADATEGGALRRLAHRALDAAIVPIAIVTLASVLFVWHCATARGGDR